MKKLSILASMMLTAVILFFPMENTSAASTSSSTDAQTALKILLGKSNSSKRADEIICDAAKTGYMVCVCFGTCKGFSDACEALEGETLLPDVCAIPIPPRTT